MTNRVPRPVPKPIAVARAMAAEAGGVPWLRPAVEDALVAEAAVAAVVAEALQL
jgi:hypothetical protein